VDSARSIQNLDRSRGCGSGRVCQDTESVFRGGDIVFRQGGDEFLILMPETTEEQADFSAPAPAPRSGAMNLNSKKDFEMAFQLGAGVRTSPVRTQMRCCERSTASCIRKRISWCRSFRPITRFDLSANHFFDNLLAASLSTATAIAHLPDGLFAKVNRRLDSPGLHERFRIYLPRSPENHASRVIEYRVRKRDPISFEFFHPVCHD